MVRDAPATEVPDRHTSDPSALKSVRSPALVIVRIGDPVELVAVAPAVSVVTGWGTVNGRMVYEFNGSPCEGYTVTFRFVTKIETDETTRLTDQQSATFEEGDGKGFRFVTKSYVNSALDKELDGKAELTAKETNVRITKPAGDEIELPVTQFPTQHLLELLQRAESGETFYETTLFDGSDNADQVMTTTVIIGKTSAPQTNDRGR